MVTDSASGVADAIARDIEHALLSLHGFQEEHKRGVLVEEPPCRPQTPGLELSSSEFPGERTQSGIVPVRGARC
jgi:hypothetical protein